MAATHFSGPVKSTDGFQAGAGSYESITAAKTLVAADNGKTFGLNAAAGVAITLPALADMPAGWVCRFRVETVFATSDWVVTAPAAIMIGGVNELEVDTADDGPSTTGGTTITFELGFETVGDYIDLQSNGTNIYLIGQTVLDGGISFA